ncbi:MAG TPA: hypothetical protein VNP04_15690 [Alphaproteobacteria bacterium]|nr:hypothetical protein [Alphaproteobacteria bacterium]
MLNLQPMIEAIAREIAHAEAKRPQAIHHEIPSWLAIMRRELAEAEEAWVCGDGAAANTESLREILQVVATGIRCLMQHGIKERDDAEYLQL